MQYTLVAALKKCIGFPAAGFPVKCQLQLRCLQLLVHCFSQMFQSKWGLNYTLVYLQGTLGSYICIKNFTGSRGGAALHFQGKEKFDFTFTLHTFMIISEKKINTLFHLISFDELKARLKLFKCIHCEPNVLTPVRPLVT